MAKLEARLRRSHDRRRVTARRTKVLVGRGGTAVLDELPGLESEVEPDVEPEADVNIPVPRAHGDDLPADDLPADDLEPIPGRVVRQKVHPANPMSVEDALSRMELVGHDFYLFADADSGAPSVVYRRKGYDYGVIRLGG